MIINDFAVGYENATQTEAGLMSAQDKVKLDGIAEGATNVTTSTVSGWGYTKNTGTVTSVSGTGVLSGTVTTSGNITHNNSGVTAGTYGSSTTVPVVTVNSTGHVTGVSTQSIGGGLSWNYEGSIRGYNYACSIDYSTIGYPPIAIKIKAANGPFSSNGNTLRLVSSNYVTLSSYLRLETNQSIVYWIKDSVYDPSREIYKYLYGMDGLVVSSSVVFQYLQIYYSTKSFSIEFSSVPDGQLEVYTLYDI